MIALFALLLASTHPLPAYCTADGGGLRVSTTDAIEPLVLEFPEMAARAGAAGTCVIAYQIRQDGQPVNACTACNAVVDETSDERFTEVTADVMAIQMRLQALRSISRLRFAPASQGLERCAVTELRFLLEGDDPARLPETPVIEACSWNPVPPQSHDHDTPENPNARDENRL